MTVYNLDQLDRSLLNSIKRDGSLTLTELASEHPDVNYYTIRYRILTMAEGGFIRLVRARQKVTCFPVSQE